MTKYKIQPFLKETYRVSQLYGNNPDYYKQFGLKGHEGIDYATPDGTSIYAPFDGIVLRDVDDPKSGNYGIYIVVWDPIQKCALWFCHLQDNFTNNGDKVKKGDLLGHTDNSGNTTGPHLHVNFVETDASGNRLNKDNGYQGFLNLSDYVDFIDESSPVNDLSVYNPQAKINLSNLGIMEAQAVISTIRDTQRALNDCKNKEPQIQYILRPEASSVPNWIRKLFGDSV